MKDPLSLNILCQTLVKNRFSGPGEEVENIKIADRPADKQTDNGQKVMEKSHSSFQFRWSKNNK